MGKQEPESDSADDAAVHRRRPHYSGKNPRRFEEKYKEHNPDQYLDTVEKVLASGKTPAGMHRPIMVAEITAVLEPAAGEVAVDATLGYGGHAREILSQICPDGGPAGRLIGLDCDPIELPLTQARLRDSGYGPESFSAHLTNFSDISKILAVEGLTGVDCILADLGVSSMQIDNPVRGFSVKAIGPLDMRMNPTRGQSAGALLERLKPWKLVEMLEENSDEPHASDIAKAIAGRKFATTVALADAVRSVFRKLPPDEREQSVRRVFQALRIAVNDELNALDTFLEALPSCLNPGGRVAILTFHSGEDRRVKKAFKAGLLEGIYSDIADEVIRATPEERRDNPRSTSAKLRWAIKE
jgi:16S rRNA (cytosine1402-N4)-methyltransferase